jgi:sugar lactone lactonase YvrE
MRGALVPVLITLALAPDAVAAPPTVPPGFTIEVYVTGDGYTSDAWRGLPGIPSTTTMAVDADGVLYLARSGRRYSGGEAEDLGRVYRIPPGGARLTPQSESRYLVGPPLPNPQVASVRGGRELLVTTFDRDRVVGVLYRMLAGRAELLAGGTPPRGTAPVLKQPEGAVADAAGNVYIADRAQGVVLRLSPQGEVLDPRVVSMGRPRLLALGPEQLWVAADGTAEAPWLRGPGEIWQVSPEGKATLILTGPVVAGMSVGPAGRLFVADRQGGEIFMLEPDGKKVEFARFGEGDAPRTLAFVPVTPETRRSGIAGDLLVVTVSRGAWPVNEVVRVSGPFERFVQEGAAAAR